MTDRNARALVATELVAALDLLPELDFSHGIDAFRAQMAERQRPPVAESLAHVRCDERLVPGKAGDPDVRVLVYTPPHAAAAPRPAVLHLHGGGYVLGDPEINDAGSRAMALEQDCIVVSVDYRLAPETRFPGARDDNHAALCWLRDAASSLGVDQARIAVAGESAGAGHAAAVAVHARDRGGPTIAFLLLEAPMLDDRTCTADPHPHCGRLVWTPERNRFGWGALLGVEPGSPDVPPDGSPARAADLAGLPPTFISIGALDLFLEETLDWTRRLARAGVAVELHVVPGAYHGFGVAAQSPQARQMAEWRRAALARAFAK